MKYRILCCGMIRSGSTWLYNVVRLMVKYKTGSVYAKWCQQYKNTNKNDWHVVKIHGYQPDLITDNTKVITTHRDLRDIIASASVSPVTFGHDTKQPGSIKNRLTRIISYHEKYMTHNPMDICYEKMIVDKPTTIKRIAEYIGFDLTSEEIARIHNDVEGLVIPRDSSDTITLLHPGHKTTNGRTGYYSDRLGPETIKLIEENFFDWLKQYGYMGA